MESAGCSTPEGKKPGGELTDFDLNRARLTLSYIDRFIDREEFPKIARGAFVRIAAKEKGREMYKVAQIVRLVETLQPCSTGASKTNLAAEIAMGKDITTVMLKHISRDNITYQEFLAWRSKCVSECVPFPSLEFINTKAVELKSLRARRMTEKDESMVELNEVAKLQDRIPNFTKQRLQLEAQAVFAASTGKSKQLAKVTKKLVNVEMRASVFHTARTLKTTKMHEVNERNRDLSIKGAEAALIMEANVPVEPEGIACIRKRTRPAASGGIGSFGDPVRSDDAFAVKGKTDLHDKIESCKKYWELPLNFSPLSPKNPRIGSPKNTTFALNTTAVAAETATVGAETATVGAETATVGAETATVEAESATVGAETATVGAETATVDAETTVESTENSGSVDLGATGGSRRLSLNEYLERKSKTNK